MRSEAVVGFFERFLLGGIVSRGSTHDRTREK